MTEINSKPCRYACAGRTFEREHLANIKAIEMKRRNFVRSTSMGFLGLGAIGTQGAGQHSLAGESSSSLERTAKNIIFLVSDGMSAGTFQLAELYSRVKYGSTTHWGDLLRQGRVRRALMDTASANSWVTDSAAASSAWGGGVRVPNGSLNVGPGGERYRPILQKFKDAGKAVGCVTSVPITHATPAGFCVNQASRGDQAEIASEYLKLRFDCMLGGGREHFSADKRADKRDLFKAFREASFHVPGTLAELQSLPADQQPVLGSFYESGIPYALDHQQDTALKQTVPDLATMSRVALERLSKHPKGFVLQIEGGKVDWAAHANDTTALIYDQLAFYAAVREAVAFADQVGETLVIITTDHGNANPGILGTTGANKKFESLLDVRHTNTWVFEGLPAQSGIDEIRQRIQFAQGLELTNDEAKVLYEHIADLSDEDRKDPRKLPFAKLADIQKKHTAIGWAGDDHSGDYVELSMLGPGSEMLPTFVKNTDLHPYILRAAGLPADVQVG